VSGRFRDQGQFSLRGQPLPTSAVALARTLGLTETQLPQIRHAVNDLAYNVRKLVLHHIEIYVSNLDRTVAFWTPFMKKLGYEADSWSGGMNYVKEGEAYLCFLPAPNEHIAAGYHRKRVGLNHLAFRGESRAQVDDLAAWVTANGHKSLYEAKYPHASGPNYYALYCEDPDRIKVEVVAPREA
jgi:catechol 2,3-dioxygenase-like lactoylglutathione lyase family enzyme